jgi:nucleoside-diphosphate-sugar epimerase
MKILITGAAGFTATHLAKELAARSGPAAGRNELFFTGIRADRPEHCADYIQCDLSQFEPVRQLIDSIRPDRIYHLAGSFSNTYELDYQANVLSTRNVLESVLRAQSGARVLLVGSSAEYGTVTADDNPIREDHPLKPISIYGLTKVFQTQLMDYYCRVNKLNIVMARTFNIFGKGMSNRLFVGRLHEQIDKYRRGEIEKITVGNLKSKRDYIDIADAVKLYEAIMAGGKAGEIYNVGSGSSIKIHDLLTRMLAEAGLTHDVVEEQVFPQKSQNEVADIHADMSKTNAIAASSVDKALNTESGI